MDVDVSELLFFFDEGRRVVSGVADDRGLLDMR